MVLEILDKINDKQLVFFSAAKGILLSNQGIIWVRE